MLVAAARDGDIAFVKKMLAVGFDVNTSDNDGVTALHWAAYKLNADLAKMLLTTGANVDSRNTWGSTALHWAASMREPNDVVGMLLAAGVNVNCANAQGETALHCAAKHSNVHLVKILLAAGADISRDVFAVTANYKQHEIREILAAELRWATRRVWLRACVC